MRWKLEFFSLFFVENLYNESETGRSMFNLMHIVILCSLMLSKPLTKGVDMKQNITHETRDESIEAATQSIIHKIQVSGNSPESSVDIRLKLVEALYQSELGKFLLLRGGLNGYWTEHIVKHPQRQKNSSTLLPEIDDFLLNHSPSVLATQQRYGIFKTEIQKQIKNGSSLMSIPCGLMSELLDLDYSGYQDIQLTGIDTDAESLTLARAMAEESEFDGQCQFLDKNAWHLDMHEVCDVLVSNGLSIYEYDDDKVIELYREFFKALRPGGVLITSFLTPPPALSSQSEWDLDQIDLEALKVQKILFADILECKWQAYRTETTVKNQLRSAGFKNFELIYDKARIFPTITARKPND